MLQQTEKDIWSGTAGAGTFDGFATLLTAATLPAGQDITGVAVTAANVIAELGKVADAVPSNLYGIPKIYISMYLKTYGEHTREH